MGDGSGAEPATIDSAESQQVCTTIEIPNDNKGEGDGSDMHPKYNVVCEEVKKT